MRSATFGYQMIETGSEDLRKQNKYLPASGMQFNKTHRIYSDQECSKSVFDTTCSFSFRIYCGLRLLIQNSSCKQSLTHGPITHGSPLTLPTEVQLTYYVSLPWSMVMLVFLVLVFHGVFHGVNILC